MKKFLPVIILFFIGLSCANQKMITEPKPRSEEAEGVENTAANDSVEYNIETFDSKFEN